MAYLSQDDILNELEGNGQNDQQNPANQQAGAVGSQDGSSFVSSASSGNVSQGRGGVGSWTNIQDYIRANQGYTGGSDILKENINNKIESDRSALQQTAQDTKNQAQDQINSISSVDDARNNINQASQWSANRADGSWSTYNKPLGYSDYINPLYEDVRATYQGPTNYSYDVDQTLDERMKTLASGNRNDLHGIMNQLYADKLGGRQLTTGQSHLQKQFDLLNPELFKARDQALASYDTYMGDVGQAVQDTNAYLGQAQTDFGTRQSDLINALRSDQQSDYDAILNRLASVRAQEAAQQSAGPGNRGNVGFYINAGNDSWFVPGSVQSATSADKFYGYDKGNWNTSNLTGVDQQRNRLNTIEDVLAELSSIDYINQADQAGRAGQWNFKNNLFDNWLAGAAGNVRLGTGASNAPGISFSRDREYGRNGISSGPADYVNNDYYIERFY